MAHVGETYKQSRLHPSRIDLLLDLLHATEDCVKQTLQATRAQQDGEAFRLRSRGLVLVGGLQSGQDPSGLEITAKISQLYEYVQHCLVQGDEAQLTSALRVLRQLAEGFEGIREEANRLEETGSIPPALTAPVLDTSC